MALDPNYARRTQLAIIAELEGAAARHMHALDQACRAVDKAQQEVSEARIRTRMTADAIARLRAEAGYPEENTAQTIERLRRQEWTREEF